MYKERKIDFIKVFSIILFLLFILSVAMAIDAGYSYYYAAAGGEENISILYKILGYPNGNMSLEGYSWYFQQCTRFTVAMSIANILFYKWRCDKKSK